MSIAVIHLGEPHPLGWVPTQLRQDDELGSFSGHIVPTQRNLAELYGMSARAIVEGNGYPFTADAIEGDGGWIHKGLAGGSGALVNGKWHFTGKTIIFLPKGGPRPPALVVIPGTTSNGRAGVALALLFGVPIVVGGAVALVRRLRKKG